MVSDTDGEGQGSPRPRTLTRVLARLVPVSTSTILCVLIGYRFDGYGIFARIDPALLLVALGLALFLETTVGAFKWWQVTVALGINARFGEVWRLWVGLLPATFFAPFQSGHLLYAFALRNAKKVSTFAALECVVYDKALTLAGTVALVGFGQLMVPKTHPFSHPLVAIGSLAFVLAFLGKRVLLRHLSRFRFIRERSRLLQHPVSPGKEICLLALAALYQGSDVLSMYLVCRGLGVAVDPTLVFGLLPVVLLLSVVPISVNGFGVRENLIAVVFALTLTYDEAIAIGLLVDFLNYVAPALFGLAWLPRLLRVLLRGRGRAAAEGW